MQTPEDFEFLETEIGLIRGQLTEMLAHLDALQAQVDSAKACLASQHPGDCLPSNNPLWKEALEPIMPPVSTMPAPPEPGPVSWEVVFCSSVIVTAVGYYLALLLPYLAYKIR